MKAGITNVEIRQLKARAQRLEPLVRVGKDGASDALIESVDRALTDHGLIKIKFVARKEEKDELSALIAEKTGAALIMRVGHVAVLFRRKAGEAPSPENAR